MVLNNKNICRSLFDVLAAHRAVVVLVKSMTDGGKNIIVVVTAQRAGVTDVTFHLTGGLYSFALAVLMLESGKDLVVGTLALCASVTNVTVYSASGLYSLNLNIVVSVCIAANAVKALKKRKFVAVDLIKRPYALKIPTEGGCKPFLRLEIFRLNLIPSCGLKVRVIIAI